MTSEMPDEEDGGTEAEADAPAEPAPAKPAPKRSVTVEVMRPEPEQDRVLIVDFGSQVTQLIARRVREAGVYSEIVPYDKAEAALAAFAVSPAITYAENASAPRCAASTAPCSELSSQGWATAVGVGASATAHGEPGFDANVVVNLPLVEDRIGLRIAADGERQGGYIDKPLLGRDNVNRTWVGAVRGSLRGRLAEGWTLDLIGLAQATRGDQPVPRFLGDYEPIEELPHNALAIVYRVRQVSADRIAILKVVRL